MNVLGVVRSQRTGPPMMSLDSIKKRSDGSVSDAFRKCGSRELFIGRWCQIAPKKPCQIPVFLPHFW